MLRDDAWKQLMIAESKATQLLAAIEQERLIVPHKTEEEINTEIYSLAADLFGIEKYWHKRIVRAGKNTLCPYNENPPNLVIQEDDVVFLDLGPILETWEADVGRTYVVGNNPLKLKLKHDVEQIWLDTTAWYYAQTEVTGATLYQFAVASANQLGWDFGGEIAGHLIGQFPHEKIVPKNYALYIHPDNQTILPSVDQHGKPRHWILEIHLVDRVHQIGGFFEQLLV